MKAVSTGHLTESLIAGVLMRAIFVVALLSLAACEKSPTAPATAFLVTAFATPQAIKSGTQTVVIVGITNVTNKAQTFESNFCGPAFSVTTSSGANPYGGFFCFSYSAPKTLAPGEQVVYSSEWTTTGVDSTGHSTGPLPAGTYTLRGALNGTNVNNIAFAVQLTP